MTSAITGRFSPRRMRSEVIDGLFTGRVGILSISQLVRAIDCLTGKTT
jgi:hypothetical protein